MEKAKKEEHSISIGKIWNDEKRVLNCCVWKKITQLLCMCNLKQRKTSTQFSHFWIVGGNFGINMHSVQSNKYSQKNTEWARALISGPLLSLRAFHSQRHGPAQHSFVSCLGPRTQYCFFPFALGVVWRNWRNWKCQEHVQKCGDTESTRFTQRLMVSKN